MVLDKIIEAGGAVVPDIFFRTGRRHVSVDGARDLKRKPTHRQRIQSNTAYLIHPDAQEARDALLGR
jgi:hypothetical protein